MKISFNRLDLRTQLLKGASPLAGSAATGLFAFHRLRVARSAMDN